MLICPLAAILSNDTFANNPVETQLPVLDSVLFAEWGTSLNTGGSVRALLCMK
jgi:hypothetical protein